MHIIIDGYNLIRQSDLLRRQEKQSLEAGRRALILSLLQYKRKKSHKITVVFDGWESGQAHEERDRQGNINIIYSRRGEKADEVIKRLADKSSEETIIVSSDREIVASVTRRGTTALSSNEFETLMYKAEIENTIDGFADKDEDNERTGTHQSKKGPSRRLPRAERDKQLRMKKL